MTVLTQQDIDHFMEHGYIVLHNCFGKAQTEWMLRDVWTRLDVDCDNQSQWNGRTHLPNHRKSSVKEFAPKAWNAICELLGGADKIGEKGHYWTDSVIVNLGGKDFTEATYPKNPQDLTGWHVDGDFFLHFLDSPEQALLVIPVFSDEIKKQGGGTFITPESIPIVAKILADSPKGLGPFDIDYRAIAKQCTNFVEVTGKMGDVVLLHPFMMHSAAPNLLRIPRFITNPPVDLAEPFRFDKPYEELSIVERKTVKSIGVEAPYHFEIGAERQMYNVNKRIERFENTLKTESQRLKDLGRLEAFLQPFRTAVAESISRSQ
jgi:Phytanoyl-CoA dioxygenase (PhyH)